MGCSVAERQEAGISSYGYFAMLLRSRYLYDEEDEEEIMAGDRVLVAS